MSEPSPVLRVALPVPLPRLFDYRPPASTSIGPSDIGRRVQVPFGSRSLIGVVAEIGPPELNAIALRETEAWLDPGPVLQGELLGSLRWLARYTHAPLGEVLATALPAALRRGEPLPITHAWAWRLTLAGTTALPKLRGLPKRVAELLAEAAAAAELAAAELGVLNQHILDQHIPDQHGLDQHGLDQHGRDQQAVGEPVIGEHAFESHPDATVQDGWRAAARALGDRKSTRLNSSHSTLSRMPSSA